MEHRPFSVAVALTMVLLASACATPDDGRPTASEGEPAPTLDVEETPAPDPVADVDGAPESAPALDDVREEDAAAVLESDVALEVVAAYFVDRIGVRGYCTDDPPSADDRDGWCMVDVAEEPLGQTFRLGRDDTDLEAEVDVEFTGGSWTVVAERSLVTGEPRDPALEPVTDDAAIVPTDLLIPLLRDHFADRIEVHGYCEDIGRVDDVTGLCVSAAPTPPNVFELGGPLTSFIVRVQVAWIDGAWVVVEEEELAPMGR